MNFNNRQKENIGRNYGETMHEDMFKHATDLHDRIKELYKSTCCRVMTRNLGFQSLERIN